MQISAEAVATDENILTAKIGLKPNTAVGHDGVAAEMLRVAPPSVDRMLATARYAKLMNWSGSGPVADMAKDACWEEAEARLLPKNRAPTYFTGLRPIIVLVATGKLWSRWCFDWLSAYDLVAEVAVAARWFPSCGCCCSAARNASVHRCSLRSTLPGRTTVYVTCRS